MNSVALCGLRGGVGTTSLAAALGYALQRQGQRVLVVDLCPENMLGLHFNLGVADPAGWARADLDEADWRSAGYEAMPGLALLPYGRVSAAEAAEIERRLAETPDTWRARRTALARAYDWLLFDLPQRLPGHQAAGGLGEGGCDLQLRVVHPDPACFALLARWQEASPHALALVNRYDPARRLQRDLLQVWLGGDGARFASPRVHDDLAMAEAMAGKRPVGLYAPHSQAAADADSLAIWCLARAAGASAVAG